MTILQANKYFYLRGGAERYVFELSDWLEAEGHRVVPFAMEHPDNRPTPYSAFFPRFVQTDRAKLSPAGLRTAGRMVYSFESRRKMRDLVAAERPDIAHVHNIYTQLSPSILTPLRAAGVPVVMTVHDHHLVSAQYNLWAKDCGENFRDPGLFRAAASRFHKGSVLASVMQAASFRFARWRRLYARNVRLFLCPSEYMARELVRAGFDEASIRVIPHGINPDRIAPRYDHDGYFLFVGRLSEEKGIDTVLRIAKLLPDIRFKIVGTGPDEPRLHAAAHGMENVEFMGYRLGEELRELYRGAIGVLLPSQVEEVFPLILLEAMAAGKPVIASNVGGVSEAVHDRGNGFLVPPLDLHGWVEAAVRLAYDDDLRVALGRQGRLRTETTFHVHRHMERVMSAYQEARSMRMT